MTRSLSASDVSDPAFRKAGGWTEKTCSVAEVRDMIDQACLWRAVLERDRRFDGQFVFAVRTTGVYCRPSCPARRPRREHVVFFTCPEEAEHAGFRPCRRCHPHRARPPEPNRELVERVCRALEEWEGELPSLKELAQQFAVSPFHLHRTFKRITGVTPRQYADARRQERFRHELRNGGSVSGALYDAGYGASSSLYEGVDMTLGMTPGTYRRGGRGATILYTLVPCPLGYLLVAATERGICAVRLGDTESELEDGLRREFPAARLERDEATLGRWVRELLDYLEGNQPHLDLPLDVRATAFQRRVWEALRAIPRGSTRSYREIAEAIGQPTAARAVARACAANPVALVVPCHRVVREDGGLGGYRWGIERKRALLDLERRGSACESTARFPA
ncbi:Bifunctional transcriptional activator/DNA repair enzyme Ada [bacterium HR26]|nr:Bifunctional transcriptional activator/DNA repair enzyme Ada [bacterium HR26]